MPGVQQTRMMTTADHDHVDGDGDDHDGDLEQNIFKNLYMSK